MNTIVSYLVPSYNHARYLPALLESIKADIESLSVLSEIIIVDDGSSDASRTIIEEWVEKNIAIANIKLEFFGENKGIPVSFNKLVDLANGEYLRFCGSDDVIVRGSTGKLLDSFANRPQLVCVFGDALVIGADDSILHRSSIEFHGGRRTRLANPRTLTVELVQRWCIAGPSMLIKRNHYANMRYDENLKIDDYDLILSLLEKPASVLFLNDVVCHYRIHLTNTSKTRDLGKRIENMRSFLFIVDKYMSRKVLINELLPVLYITRGKLNFLMGHYAASIANVVLFGFLRIKNKIFQ